VSIFRRKHDGPKLTPEEREVAALDAFVARMSPEAQKALAGMLLNLMPGLVAQLRKSSALPVSELGEHIKGSLKRLLFRFTSPMECLEAIGKAFLTHAPTIQGICSAVASEYLRRDQQLRALEGQEPARDVIDVTPPLPKLEPVP
jgi:hypothetical protein